MQYAHDHFVAMLILGVVMAGVPIAWHLITLVIYLLAKALAKALLAYDRWVASIAHWVAEKVTGTSTPTRS